jgi:hypothetical protein
MLRKQLQYQALRTISTSDLNNPFYDQAGNARLLQEIVENIQILATDRILASGVIIRDIGHGKTPSPRNKTSGLRRTTPAAPVHPPSPPRPASPPSTLPPPPRRDEHYMDERGSPSARHDVEQPVNNSAEPYESLRDEEIEAGPRMVETALEGPTGSGHSGPNTSTRRLSLSHSATVSNQSFPQELPAAGPRDRTPQPEPPPRPRYRMVVRKGKMVPKEWRRPGADDDESDSPSSDSE